MTVRPDQPRPSAHGTSDARRPTGTLQMMGRVHSPERDNERDLFIYLPPSYDTSERRYPVIYMHDGQNLFDPTLAFNGEWKVDEHIERLSPLGLEAIVVGIANIGEGRIDEYSPFPDRTLGGGYGNAYLRFIIETVKPMADRRFRTRPEREYTGMMGSSMGGLITLYAHFRRPHVFGFAGVMSPSLWFGNRQIFPYIESAPFVEGKLYLDIGTAEGDVMLSDVRRMHALLKKKGFRPGHDLLYVEAEGAGHSEASWERRLKAALSFLLPPV